MSPWGIPNAMVYNVGERNMPMSTFVGGFPMAAAGLNDKDGYVIGEARNRMVVMWNMWLRGKDRTNSNVYIQGIPGTGKSTLIKFSNSWNMPSMILHKSYGMRSGNLLIWPDIHG